VNFRFPVFLDLTGKKCLVTGEGYEVPMKVQALVDALANVTYVNETADPRIQALAQAGLIKWQQRRFAPGDLADCFLAISDQEDNSEFFGLCEEQHVLCNSVDDPEHCRFTFGSIHRQGELTIAISTNGSAPALAVRLRERLQRDIGPEYERFTEMLKNVRPEITSGISDFGKRRDLWYRIIDSDILQLLRSGDEPAAQSLLRELINSILRSHREDEEDEEPL
jgi:siroheme synthase-like protein